MNPDQIPRFLKSDHGIHCLLMSCLWDVLSIAFLVWPLMAEEAKDYQTSRKLTVISSPMSGNYLKILDKILIKTCLC